MKYPRPTVLFLFGSSPKFVTMLLTRLRGSAFGNGRLVTWPIQQICTRTMSGHLMLRLRISSEPAAPLSASEILIERMSEHDLLEVVAIEEMSGLSPWGWDAYYAELQSHQNSIMFVARTTGGGDSRGPIVAGVIPAPHIADENYLKNISVKPGFFTRGSLPRLLKSTLSSAPATKTCPAPLHVQ